MKLAGEAKLSFAGFFGILIVFALIVCSVLFNSDLGGPPDYHTDLSHLTDPEFIEIIIGRESVANLTTSDFDSVPTVYTMVTELLTDSSKNSTHYDLSRTEYETLVAYADPWGGTGFPKYFFFSNELFRVAYYETIS